MECWLQLNGWAPLEAVLHIHHHCTSALQRSLDASFTMGQWQVLSIETLDTIGRIVLQATNQAADWCGFFAATHLLSESSVNISHGRLNVRRTVSLSGLTATAACLSICCFTNKYLAYIVEC